MKSMAKVRMERDMALTFVAFMAEMRKTMGTDPSSTWQENRGTFLQRLRSLPVMLATFMVMPIFLL